MLADFERTSGVYIVLLIAHIVSVVVGIGGVMLNGVYGAQAKARPGPAGRAIVEANYKVTEIATYAIYAIPVFGVLLVLASHDAVKFSQPWLGISILLYIIALGISHGVMKPAVKQMLGLMTEMEQGPPPAGGPPPQAASMAALGQRLAAGGATLNLIAVAIIVLMVWKPGL